ncbi:MAG: lanthionine synthetase LanC family protein [Sulfuricellaceae bacterium]
MNQPASPFLETADRIGRKLCREAVWDGKRCTWLGWSMEAVNQAWVPAYRSYAAELYSGTSGIALFLAELHRYTNDPEQRRALEGAVNQTLSLTGSLQGAARIGFYSGISGIAYALARIGALLEHEKLIARSLAEMSTLKDIAPDKKLIDVIGGSAGAIPALLALGHSHGRPDFIETATTHGDHLLKTAMKSDQGWSWDTMHIPGQKNLTGHSHGVAGIVTALLELHRATGATRFRDGALHGLRYERSLFNPAYNNWPDLRIMNPGATEQAPVYNMAWCHGAPGIGLSRLRNFELLDGDGEVRKEMDAAIQATATALSMPWTPGMGNYSLCHGASGNAELLLMAAQQLNRPELRQIAEKIGWEGYQHYAQPEMPWPCGVNGGGETPNLMLGAAGIGHYYLRLHDVEKVPSVLIITPA